MSPVTFAAEAVKSPAVDTKKFDAEISPPASLNIGTPPVPPLASKLIWLLVPSDIDA